MRISPQCCVSFSTSIFPPPSNCCGNVIFFLRADENLLIRKPFIRLGSGFSILYEMILFPYRNLARPANVTTFLFFGQPFPLLFSPDGHLRTLKSIPKRESFVSILPLLMSSHFYSTSRWSTHVWHYPRSVHCCVFLFATTPVKTIINHQMRISPWLLAIKLAVSPRTQEQ